MHSRCIGQGVWSIPLVKSSSSASLYAADRRQSSETGVEVAKFFGRTVRNAVYEVATRSIRFRGCRRPCVMLTQSVERVPANHTMMMHSHCAATANPW